MWGLLDDSTLAAIVADLEKARAKSWMAHPSEAGALNDAKQEVASRAEVDVNDPPAWALGQDPYRCEGCGSFLIDNGAEEPTCWECDA